ncbi:hypothetical protein NL676_037132 [Syzygium grande]|nr:hypothetical protein NL676_037132 [Syzygium grande]
MSLGYIKRALYALVRSLSDPGPPIDCERAGLSRAVLARTVITIAAPGHGGGGRREGCVWLVGAAGLLEATPTPASARVGFRRPPTVAGWRLTGG